MEKLSRLWENVAIRSRGRPQNASQLANEDDGDSDIANAAAGEAEEAARRKISPASPPPSSSGGNYYTDPDAAAEIPWTLKGGDGFADEAEQDEEEDAEDEASLRTYSDASMSPGDDAEAAARASAGAWAPHDRHPLLVAAEPAAFETDTSGEIDIEEDDAFDEAAEAGGLGRGNFAGLGGFDRGGGSGSGSGGVFNQGFLDDELAELEARDREAAAAEGGDEFLDDDGDEFEDDEDAFSDDEFDDEDEDEDDEDECFGADLVSAGGIANSLTDAPAQRPKPKIVGFLEAEMIFDAKGPGVNVRIMQVELLMALTKLRRKSNKKMRWTEIQVCLTLLPDKSLKFRTPMVEHEDPKKKDLLALAAAAEAANAADKADSDKDAGEEDKDATDGKKKKKKKKKKGKDGATPEVPGAAKPPANGGDSGGHQQVKIGKLSIPKLAKKSKAKESAVPERGSKKSVLATITARRQAQQLQQQQRREQWQQQQQLRRARLREERLKRKLEAANKPSEEPTRDVTRFSEPPPEEEGKAVAPGAAAAAAAAAAAVAAAAASSAKKLGAKDSGDKKDADVYRFVPVYAYQLRRNAQPALAIRFRVYGCWRQKRSYLLGENTFALERMDEAQQLGRVRQNRFRLQLEERRFELSKLKHLSDSEEEHHRRKLAAKAKKKLAKDSVDAPLVLPPPTEGPMLVTQAELFLGLSYKQVNGHLEIEVVKACNLDNPKSNRPPTAYVKLQLLWGPFPEKRSAGRVLFKSKTLAIPDCKNPAWHETFAFPVSKSHLNDVSLMAKVYCKHTLSRTVTIGWCSVGRNNCSEEALDHWSDMRDAAGKQVRNWHVLLKVSKEKTEGQLDSD